MTRVLILSNSPTPYNDALFARVAHQAGVTLKVIYCARLEPHRLWELDERKGYDYAVAPGVSIGATHFNPGVGRAIADFRPDVAVLTGSYVMPTFHLATRALEKLGVPWLYWGEELSSARVSPAAAVLRRRLRQVLKRARMILAIGSRAASSYARLGIPTERVVDFRYYADIEHFQLATSAAADARMSIREQWKVAADTSVFIYCGQLIPRKGVDTLLRAAAIAAREGVALHVVLVGAGEQEQELRRLAETLDTAGRVTFAGFVQPSELPRVFAAADALVLPSMQEGWGLVVPEALAAGLPVIASDRVNSAADLVVDGESGFRFPYGDTEALADSMRAVSAALATSSAMRQAARDAVADETPAGAAERLVTLINSVITPAQALDVG